MTKCFSLFLLTIAFSVPGFAQFSANDVYTLKRSYRNYAESGCRDRSLMRSAAAIEGELRYRENGKVTPRERGYNRQLDKAVKRLRRAAKKASVGDRKDCVNDIKRYISDLDDLPIGKRIRPSDSSGKDFSGMLDK